MVYVFIAVVEILIISLTDESLDDEFQLPTLTELDWMKPNDTITIHLDSLKGIVSTTL